MKSGIYKIYNKVNGKIYIGQAVDVDNRLRSHINELKKGSHINYFLQKDFNEYKEENFVFEKIHSCDEEFLNPMEKYFIEKFNTTNNGYNIRGGNSSIKTKIKRDEEERRKREKEEKSRIEAEEKDLLLKEFDSINHFDVTLDNLLFNAYNFYCEFYQVTEGYFDVEPNNDKRLPTKLFNALENVEQEMYEDFFLRICDGITVNILKQLEKYKRVIEVCEDNGFPDINILRSDSTTILEICFLDKINLIRKREVYGITVKQLVEE